MINVRPENYECAQGSGQFTTWVFEHKGCRFFSTEEIGYILASADTLEIDGATVILEWDRNSSELPDLGPVMDATLKSKLFLHRVDSEVHLEEASDRGRAARFSISYSEWAELIKRLKAEPAAPDNAASAPRLS